MKDLLIGLATDYDWPDVEPFAVSLVRSGFAGDKVLLAHNLTDLAIKNLTELGFELIVIPPLEYSDPALPRGKYFAMVGRFLVIHKYLEEHPWYRFVFCTDVRDVVFQHDPAVWAEKNIGDKKLIAASEHIRHKNQPHNAAWLRNGFQEVQKYLLDDEVYCAGFISGVAEWVSDLCLGIYLAGRHLSGSIWGVDQPVYNFLMHQRAMRDITIVPHLHYHGYCINLAVVACDSARMTQTIRIAEDGGTIAQDLNRYCVVHQYDRIPELAQFFQKEYTLDSLHQKSD